MTEKKYQIFVSSTYEDLKDERSKIIETILKMHHFPIGMEMFSADNDEQWNIIKNTIDSSDYYILIIGNRYGSLTNEGISFTEKEYNYAKSENIPILGYIKDRKSDDDKNKKLDKFIESVKKQGMCEFWDTIEVLSKNVAIALPKLFVKYKRNGWIRSNQIEKSNLESSLSEKQTEKLERNVHDKKIFGKSNIILNEDSLGSIMFWLESDQSFELIHFHKIDEFINFFSKISNQYINENLIDSCSNLTISLGRLLLFMIDEFYEGEFSTITEKRYLHPELNIDRDAVLDNEQPDRDERLNTYSQELFEHTKKVKDNFIEYRKTIKDELVI